MHPKNTALFRLAVITSLVGLWLFALSMYWIMMVNPNNGAKLVGYIGWVLGGLSIILLVAATLVKPRPQPIRTPKTGSASQPYKMSKTSMICLPLAIAGYIASVALILQNYVVLGGLIGGVAGVFSAYEKWRRDYLEYRHKKQQKSSKS